jgi:hypothetical protein
MRRWKTRYVQSPVKIRVKRRRHVRIAKRKSQRRHILATDSITKIVVRQDPNHHVRQVDPISTLAQFALEIGRT